jgi:hypothetical protein
MRLVALRVDDQALDLLRQLVGIAHRPPRPVGESEQAVLSVPTVDLVTCLAGYTEPQGARRSSRTYSSMNEENSSWGREVKLLKWLKPGPQFTSRNHVSWKLFWSPKRGYSADQCARSLSAAMRSRARSTAAPSPAASSSSDGDGSSARLSEPDGASENLAATSYPVAILVINRRRDVAHPGPTDHGSTKPRVALKAILVPNAVANPLVVGTVNRLDDNAPDLNRFVALSAPSEVTVNEFEQ